ncbi:MAG: CdaR family protein [Myxococcota bacterium]
MSEERRHLAHRLFVENYAYKLISTALVLVLFFLVLDDREAEVSVVASVRFVVPEGKLLMNNPVDRMRVTLRGRRTAIERFAEQELEPVVVNLSERSGEETVSLPPSIVQVPAGLRAVRTQPSFLRVHVAPRATRSVPVRARLIGEPPQGYRIQKVRVVPDVVEVNGPQESVQRTKVVLTAPIDLLERRESFEESVDLRFDEPSLSAALDEPVRVLVEVGATEVERLVRGLPVRVVNTTRAHTLNPQKIDVTVRGPKKLVEGIDEDKLIVSIDMADAAEAPSGTFQKQPIVRNLPKGVEVAELYPTDFQVTLTVAQP